MLKQSVMIQEWILIDTYSPIILNRYMVYFFELRVKDFIVLLWFAGFIYGVDTLKSVILTLACVERFLTAETAVHLSRLEEEYQVKKYKISFITICKICFSFSQKDGEKLNGLMI